MVTSPVIIFELDRVVANARRLRDIAASALYTRKVEIFYAVKSHASQVVVEALHPIGIGCEVMTVEQHSWGAKLGMRMIASGLFKPSRLVEVAEGLEYLVVETPHEITRLTKQASDLGRTLRIALRVKAQTHSKIGFSLDEIGRIGEISGIEVVAAHFHAGWNNRDDETLRAAACQLMKACSELARLGHHIRIVNFGGSFCEHSADQGQLQRRFEIYRNVLSDDIKEVHLEPGRYLVGDAGVLHCKIEFVDWDNRRIYIDSCAYGYRLTGATPRVELVGARREGSPGVWSLHGFWPSDSDVLNDVSVAGEPQAGGALLLHNMGAYTVGLEAQFSLNAPIHIRYV